MAIKRFAGKDGTLVVLQHESKVLKDNLLGDPHIRKLGVWLPPQYDGRARAGRNAPGRRFPVLFDLVGFTGSGLAHTGWRRFSDNVPERAARLIHESPHGAGDPRVPRLLHRAGRQSVHQLVGGRQLRRLSDA